MHSIYIENLLTSRNLQKRELFLFCKVLAFPKASKIGLEFMIVFSSMVLSDEMHKKSTMFFVDSVFPEPVIPEITID